jgi:hypothetical protein
LWQAEIEEHPLYPSQGREKYPRFKLFYGIQKHLDFPRQVLEKESLDAFVTRCLPSMPKTEGVAGIQYAGGHEKAIVCVFTDFEKLTKAATYRDEPIIGMEYLAIEQKLLGLSLRNGLKEIFDILLQNSLRYHPK